MRVYLQGMIATGLLAAAVLDEVALYQHVDVTLDGLRGDARFSLDSRDAKAGVLTDAVEDGLLAGVQPRLENQRALWLRENPPRQQNWRAHWRRERQRTLLERRQNRLLAL